MTPTQYGWNEIVFSHSCFRMKIPVSIIEDHSDCLFQLQRLLGRNKLPLTGFAMLHFDSHPDMCASPEFREENLENAQKMRDKVSIESWILPLVVAGHLKVFIFERFRSVDYQNQDSESDRNR